MTGVGPRGPPGGAPAGEAVAALPYPPPLSRTPQEAGLAEIVGLKTAATGLLAGGGGASRLQIWTGGAQRSRSRDPSQTPLTLGTVTMTIARVAGLVTVPGRWAPNGTHQTPRSSTRKGRRWTAAPRTARGGRSWCLRAAPQVPMWMTLTASPSQAVTGTHRYLATLAIQEEASSLATG